MMGIQLANAYTFGHQVLLDIGVWSEPFRSDGVEVMYVDGKRRVDSCSAFLSRLVVLLSLKIEDRGQAIYGDI